MRYISIGFCLLLGCHQPTHTASPPTSSLGSATVFTESTIYRARCKEADALANLTVIPHKCTPRDQRLDIR
jgi:hypothetical protein